MLKLYILLTSKLTGWKHRNDVYKTVKFYCDDCHKRGLVLRQISILNLGFWLFLGLLTMTILKLCHANWFASGAIGFLVWYISTAINVKKVKPQCRHCKSINVHLPKKEAFESTVEEQKALQEADYTETNKEALS